MRAFHTWIPIAFLFCAFGAGLAGAAASEAVSHETNPAPAGIDEPNSIPGELIIKLSGESFTSGRFRSDLGSSGRTGLAALDQRLASLNAQEVAPAFRPAANRELASRIGLDRYIRVRYSAAVDPEAAAASMQDLPEVDSAAPNGLNWISLVPNDPLYASQWAHDNTGQVVPVGGGLVGTPDCDMDTPEAWDLETGGSDVIVAVIDTGCDLNHEEYASRVLPGYDFYWNDSVPSDDNGHGTACAGIILASGNNNLGVAGIAWNAKLIPIKAFSPGGSGSDEDIIDSVVFATDAGADILSMSYGGSWSQGEEDAYEYAYLSGLAMFAAAGNSNNSYLSYPAVDPNVMGIGALSPCNERKSYTSCDGEYWWGSNYGSGLEFLAPGTRIHTTDITGSGGYDSGKYYSYFNGTSAATPHAAGVCALIMSRNPELTFEEIREIMRSSCDDLGAAGYDLQTGYGRLNAYRAVEAATPPSAEFLRGDDNGDGSVDISDPIYSLAYQFAGGAVPACMDAADVDDSGEIDISDPIYSLDWQFAGGPVIPQPYPIPGEDPTADGLDCGAYPSGFVAAGGPEDGSVLLDCRLSLGVPRTLDSGLTAVPVLLESASGLLGLEMTARCQEEDALFVEMRLPEDSHHDFFSAHARDGLVRVGLIPDLALVSALPAGSAHLCDLIFDSRGAAAKRLVLEEARFVDDQMRIQVQHGGAGTVDVEPLSDSAGDLMIRYANPYPAGSVIRLGLMEAQRVEVTVHDVQGRQVRAVHQGELPAGESELSWDGRTDQGGGLGSGIYYLRIRTGPRVESRKILYLD